MAQRCKRLRNSVEAKYGSVVGEATRTSRENCHERAEQPVQKKQRRRHYRKNKTTIREEDKKPSAKKKHRTNYKKKVGLKKKHRFRQKKLAGEVRTFAHAGPTVCFSSHRTQSFVREII
jgi:hypothetical protein